MGYRLVQAVLVVTVGRLGDMFGRVRIYNAGFVVFTVASILLSFDPFHGGHGALWLIGWRVLQAVGGSMLMANSAAILTDAFPAEQRGFALGTNQIAGLAGMFVGLVAGGLLAAIDWRAVFWVNVPVGVFGTVWAYLRLRDNGERHRAAHRLVGQHHLRRRPERGPDRHHLRHPALRRAHDGLDEPVGARRAGRRRRAAGRRSASSRPGSPSRCSSSACSASGPSPPATWPAWRCPIARGGLQFMLIIWLQGIWLPLHGYDYSQTPLWAGIFLLPLTAGFLVSGPVAGFLSDRFGSRGIATAGHGGLRRQLHRPDAAARQLPLLGLRAAHRRSTGSAAGCSPRRTPPRSWAASRPGSAARPRACARPSRTPAPRCRSACSSRS